jgi:hypothetical protein
MKNKNQHLFFFWATLLFFSPAFMQGQTLSAKAFFSSDTISAVYLGIDFTQSKLINDDISDPKVIQSTQFNGINDLIVREFKKYNVQEAYQRSNWTVDLDEVEKRNMNIDPKQLKSSNDGDLYRLKSGDIDNLVKNFNYGSHKGYGILLLMEGMDKTKKLATIWFTLVDMNKKSVLSTNRVEGKLGSGFGFRNYWASAIKNAIKAAGDDYDQWKASATK